MPRRGLAALVSLFTVLTMLLIPTSPSTSAAPVPCGDIRFTITYIDPVTSNPVTVFDDSNVKFGLPVETELTFKVEVTNPAVLGNEIKFGSPNQFLELNVASISDGGVPKFNPFVANPVMNPADLRQNINWEINWAKPNDGAVTFKASIHKDDLDDPTTPALDQSLAKGRLLTIGAKVQGGKCSAKIEIFGLPNGGGPGPNPPCTGISVAIFFESTDGNFYPVINNVQSPTNTQFSGPGVGFKVKYIITSPSPFPEFPLKETDSFNRQTILSATAAGILPVINNAGPVRKVVFNGWAGQQKEVITRVLTQGLDTVTFVSTNPNGTINNLCSLHKEVRLSATPFPPPVD